MTEPKKDNQQIQIDEAMEKRGGHQDRGYAPSTPEKETLPTAPNTGSGEKK